MMLVSPRPRPLPAWLFVFTTNSTQINEKEMRDDESGQSVSLVSIRIQVRFYLMKFITLESLLNRLILNKFAIY